ncbi:MAG: radical SAM protein [Oligoflexia bacterium]|nr:radical SAM protein [Oligoflexia bacterium]
MSKKDILIINPYLSDLIPRAGGWLPPLGICYLDAYLKKHGYLSEIIDCTGQGIDHFDIRPLIISKSPRVVGISSTSPYIERAVELAKIVKGISKDIVVIFGGYHATSLGKELLEDVSEIDIVVRGEGEETFLELADLYINQQGSLDKISGITFLNMGKIQKNVDRNKIENLDQLPFPTRDCVFYPNYDMPTKWNFKKPFATIITSRGCPFNCIFCDIQSMMGRSVRFRNVEDITLEIKELIHKYEIRDIIFYDDTLTVSKKRILELCDRIINEKLNISWGCYSRVNAIDNEIALKMKQAGCRMISFGVESGSDFILEKMKKGIKAEDSINAVKICKKHGIETSVSTILGFPGETRETMKITKDFLLKLNPLFVTVFPLIPYPGTILYEKYLKQNRIDRLPIPAFIELGEVRSLKIDGLSSQEINKSVFDIYKKFYFRPKKLLEHFIRVITNRNLIRSYVLAVYWLFLQKIHKNGVLK